MTQIKRLGDGIGSRLYSGLTPGDHLYDLFSIRVVNVHFFTIGCEAVGQAKDLGLSQAFILLLFLLELFEFEMATEATDHDYLVLGGGSLTLEYLGFEGAVLQLIIIPLSAFLSYPLLLLSQLVLELPGVVLGVVATGH